MNFVKGHSAVAIGCPAGDPGNMVASPEAEQRAVTDGKEATVAHGVLPAASAEPVLDSAEQRATEAGILRW